MNDSDIMAFLTDHLRTQHIGHSGRTLFTHLLGTHDLLKTWHNTKQICDAGLYHSIYGTWHFRHKSFAIADRAVIRDLIGADAERLVHLFCVTKRPEAFLESYENNRAGTARLIDCHVKAEVEVSTDELSALLEIEAANLLEQGGRIAGYARRLVGTNVSEAAKGALTAYLATM